jgi:hypothetical protein
MQRRMQGKRAFWVQHVHATHKRTNIQPVSLLVAQQYNTAPH